MKGALIVLGSITAAVLVGIGTYGIAVHVKKCRTWRGRLAGSGCCTWGRRPRKDTLSIDTSRPPFAGAAFW